MNNAKKRSDERNAMNYGQNLPDKALNIVYVDKGFIRVTLQAKYIFDENSSALKGGVMDDVINRLISVLQSKEGQRVQITLINEIDDIVNARDVDSERALLIFSLINLKRLTPENSA